MHVGLAHSDAGLGVRIEQPPLLLADEEHGEFDLKLEPTLGAARLLAALAVDRPLLDDDPRSGAPDPGACGAVDLDVVFVAVGHPDRARRARVCGDG